MITLASILAFMAPAMFKPADKSFEKDNGWVKPDPRSIDGLIAWLETKNPAEQYDYTNGGRCLVAQYFAATGVPCWRVSGMNYYYESKTDYQAEKPSIQYPIEFLNVARPSYAEASTHSTFGNALARARKMRKRR